MINHYFHQLLAITLLVSSTTAIAERGPAIPDYPADRVAENVYVIHGPLGVPSVKNQGFMNNPAFVIGDKGVILIDPGSSVQTGEMVLRQIRKLSELPVVAVFNTHIHGDHWFANQAIRDAYPDVAIYGHEEMRKLVLKGEGQRFFETLMRMTEGAVAGTLEVPPNQSAAHGDELTIAGVTLRILFEPKAHSYSDIMIELPQQRILFLGDNVMSKRLGQMDSGTFNGNIAAIELALESRAEIYVPGHGRTGDREVPETYLDYLSSLKEEVAKHFEEGLSDFEMSPLIVETLSRFSDWVDFERNVGRHISLAYLEVEAELF
ncbi:MAG: MBL fold metallo-hydrolase [Candidatus Thiodiazotropha sp.]|nr:MBL fold metallo-hydrolase [Candidatus Thiodiazotropha sp.]MCM8884606.1 MBL fold metallo-hydrolase [Candidatus Thiodiazotropha sp.]MCM8920487.1 MBL fold metallo-hydrolase [Candidatus Thiodiazotropha sp.]